VIRLFKVYYPLRTLVLLAGEALIIPLSFLAGMLLVLRHSEYSVLELQLKNQLFIENEYLKILVVTGIVLAIFHSVDLYDEPQTKGRWAQMFRLLLVLGLAALVLAVVLEVRTPRAGEYSAGWAGWAGWGVIILVFTLFGWRAAFGWLAKHYFRERVYVLGTGERAERLVNGLRRRTGLGVDVAGWTGNPGEELTRDSVAAHLTEVVKEKRVHRVIVAMPDRRGTLPVEELLDLRLKGVRVEEATNWLEKMSGRIEVEELYPSWFIYAEGFRFRPFFRTVRRMLNFSVALVGLVLSLPLIPFVMLAVRLSSPGPVLYKQKRVGRGGGTFYCYKFRTMRQDAEADTGATWATDNDPRITKVGKFLRSSRLDEIPQLWCVLKGDMHFVGPRPERPEFVEWLSKDKDFRYYNVRHVVRPGITGWAQVMYKYGNTKEDALEKLQYDLFYIKNASLSLDLWIMFQTIKIVILGRGAQ
jgi:sugar transferase (PEP-CTERM system associated)